MAVGAFNLAMSYSGLDIPIERRKCTRMCHCKDYYQNRKNDGKIRSMFDLKI